VTRIEVVEKLRIQSREVEKERRDMQRRYNEQVRRTLRFHVRHFLTTSDADIGFRS
jgi:hypothetical protein